MSIKRDKMEVLHVEEKKAIIMTVIYEGTIEHADDICTMLGDAWHEYAITHNIDPVRGMEMIHAFKFKC